MAIALSGALIANLPESLSALPLFRGALGTLAQNQALHVLEAAVG